jgi:hypothetical protein
LIAVGVTLFAVQLLHLDADVIVLVIGLVFAIAFAGTRRYGLLIPAGILIGLGLGIVLEDFRVQGEPVVLGLGLGFLAIYAADFLTSGARAPGRWWPLIPGAILTVIAGAESTFGAEGARLIEVGWPILLIAAGAWLLLRGRIAT